MKPPPPDAIVTWLSMYSHILDRPYRWAEWAAAKGKDGGLDHIPFPRLRGEQQAIVPELDALSAETRRLASVYQRKLAALEELKKSLLHQAFAGAL